MNSGSSQDFLSAIKSDGNFKDLESPRIFIGNVASEPPQESSRILASPMGFVDSSPFNLGTPKNNFISPYIPRGEISSFVDASPSLTASLPKYVDPSKYTKSTSSLRSLPVKEEGISSKYVADLKDYNQNFALRANSLTSRNLMSGPRNAKQENNESMMYDYDNIEMFESTIKQEDDGDTALLSIKTENLQNYGFDEKNSTTIKQEISDSDSTSEFRTLSTNGESKGDKNDSSSLNDRKDSNRTVVACVVCHRAKARCDSGRPCSRCVRLGRSEECLDRPHKKRSRSSKRAASIVANATAAAVAEFGREGYLGILMGEYSPSRFKKYSSILSSIWFESCKNALQKCSESSDFVRYYNEARKITQVTDRVIMRKLFSSDVEALKEKFHKIGIVVTAPSNQLKNHLLYSGHEYEGSEPWPVAAIEFRCESALPERNSKDSDENELNGQYVCASENMTSSRKLLVSREAEKLFEYSNAEMVSFMNEGAKAANVDYPLMSRIILDDDWVRVSQLFVDTILSSRSSDAGVTTSPRTESIRCVSKSGKVTQVLVSVRLSVRVNSQSNSDADSSSNSNSIDAKVSNSKLIHSSSWFFVPVSTDPAP